MVPIKFSKEVEGTIVSPITVVLHHRAQYEGFNIQSNTENGTGILTLVNRNPVNFIIYPMTLRMYYFFTSTIQRSHLNLPSKDLTTHV